VSDHENSRKHKPFSYYTLGGILLHLYPRFDFRSPNDPKAGLKPDLSPKDSHTTFYPPRPPYSHRALEKLRQDSLSVIKKISGRFRWQSSRIFLRVIILHSLHGSRVSDFFFFPCQDKNLSFSLSYS
jgi:hypothetical protein